MWTIIAKNNSGSDQEIEDLGITIPNSGQVTLSDCFAFDRLAGSDDLRSLVNSGDLVINDGTSDLSAALGEDRLTLGNLHERGIAHYTKTNLSTSGGASVHWDNITNAPSFGSMHWIEPVEFRVLAIQSAQPAGTLGDFFVDTDDQHVYRHNGSVWVDYNTPASGDRVIKLDDAEESVYEFDGASWTDQGVPLDESAVMVGDDGDGKEAQYVYNDDTPAWVKIADVDFDGHLDGGSEKHNAQEIHVTTTLTNAASTPNVDLETTLEELDVSISAAGNSLDEAYDEGGGGSGRSITADSGAVRIDTSAATTAPLEIVPKASLPSSSLADGQIAIQTGIMYVYDNSRSKWLSIFRFPVYFGRRGLTEDQYLNVCGGVIPSNNSGIRLIRNATIVGMSAQIDASGTATFRVRKNDSATSLASLTVTAATGAQSSTTNVDLDAGDQIQAYLDSSAKVEDPVFTIELAWRD